MAKAKTKTIVKPPKKTQRSQSSKQLKTTAKPKKSLEEKDVPVIDFCGVKLTALRRAFLINYVTPGQPCFHNALQAALKAGYKESVAKTEIYNVIREPDILKIIKANESLLHQRIHQSAMRALEIKQHRAFFDPLDYFEEKEITLTNKEGDKYTKSIMDLKPLEDMTPEQRMCIDGIDIKGQANVPVYLMADREKELNDIIKIDNELAKGLGSTDEEETREIIMERVTIRETKRAQRPADIECEIVERPDPNAEDEEEEE
jgi:phage terminase small subunit